MIQYMQGTVYLWLGTYCITAAIDDSQIHASHTQLS